jgi:serine/threonine protein kinase
MSLPAGAKLGPYEILAPIGAGGMGEVYRARDPRMGREVAIKLSAERFSDRLEREVRAVAALNHPNICQIYDVGPNYLVMELVEGQTLADRIKQGAILLDEALVIARQIGDALEAAHEKGIIHRDLKPANINITPGGAVKVLDFGLAKMADRTTSGENPEVSPTVTIEATRVGQILGTAAYMAPEQARGKPVDRRADIWAFGVVLSEMLTGRRLFGGETTSDTLAAVLAKEPDWGRIPAKARRLLESCLEKDPKRRLRDIGDAWFLLEEVGPAFALPDARATSLRRRLWPGVGALLFVITGAVSFIHIREKPPAQNVLRYTIAAPENTTDIHSFAISPDGRLLVMATTVKGKRQLWLRPLGVLEFQPMSSTDDASYPFWSPDSRYIGFFAQGKLKKIAASGGPAQSLSEVSDGRGGSWNRDDVIVFSPSGGPGSGIQRVSATSGAPVNVTTPKGFSRFPTFLPDGRHFLYVVRAASGEQVEQNGVHLSSLDGKEDRRVLPDVSSVVFTAGRLLFVRENTLMAQPFDAASRQIRGPALPIAEGVTITVNINWAPVTASDGGVLLYERGRARGNQMVWFDRDGKLLGAVGSLGPVFDLAISPDERSVAFRRTSVLSADLWRLDLARGPEQRLTTHASLNDAPFWSPKGDRIVFSSNRGGGTYNLYQKATSGTGQDELLLATGNTKMPCQWSRSGQFIVYEEFDPKTKADIWVLPMDGSVAGKALPFLRSEFNEIFGQLSPDSHWMAYTSMNRGGVRCTFGRFQQARANRRFRSKEASSRAGVATARSYFLYQRMES